MNEYPGIRNILSAIFSVQTGLDDNAAKSIYLRALEADKELREELDAAFKDNRISWMEMLYNDEYEVYEAENESDALSYAKKILIV